MWELDYEESWAPKNWCFWTVVLEKTLESHWTERRSNQSILKEISPGVHWKDWCWSWNSNAFATWCKELALLRRPWCWERLRAEGEGDKRGWNGWMASPTQWTWVWVNSRSWWWTGRPGMPWFMGSQWVGHDWVTELNKVLCFGLLLTMMGYSISSKGSCVLQSMRLQRVGHVLATEQQ